MRGGRFVVLLVLFALSTRADQQSRVLHEGEELVYNVRYGFIDLGQVRVSTINKVRTASFVGYNGKAKIDSYPGVPFVDLHATFESLMDSSIFSRTFLGKTKEDNYWQFSRYQFDYENNRVILETGSRDTIIENRDTMEVRGHYNDGLSLFFFARDNLMSGKRMNIPTLVKEKKVNTMIDFTNIRTAVEVEAIDYPVDVIGFQGSAEFVGIFGLTGDFEGWFSNDDARVPILAKMKVIIGSVTIELMRWERTGWTPPLAEQ
ncbi:MAG: DUF3108 domain-containing protein [Ignavibacteria bacterium]|nr:DUF3108 domain-containing protein [Ignavibacteria bacterium]